MDNTGNLYIEMRRSDMIVTGGENVSPVKVENALLKISGIKDVAITGIEDPIWGQKVVALVVADVSNYYPEKWVEQLKSELNSYEIPRDFKQMDVLPRNELGKLNRSKLNELAV
jgi:acyl-CoA synthetase (AMP-forming)/AMP-acid ligase II